jgi:hypothetical protein
MRVKVMHNFIHFIHFPPLGTTSNHFCNNSTPNPLKKQCLFLLRKSKKMPDFQRFAIFLTRMYPDCSPQLFRLSIPQAVIFVTFCTEFLTICPLCVEEGGGILQIFP